MTNAVVLGMSIFILLLSGYLFTMYDAQICPGYEAFANTTYNETELKVEWLDYAWNSKCEGLPGWYHLLIYTPFLIIIGKSVLTVS